jgi:hypothetical protein
MSESVAASMTNLPDKSKEGEMRACTWILNEPSFGRKRHWCYPNFYLLGRQPGTKNICYIATLNFSQQAPVGSGRPY